ncbi:unnamed protein product [Protopolystoma xenopodis]|uniref:Uncharacterized protein n=1 Tax=Protopolystoma xenopodis TaxID=117903 RepID=A0A448X8E4_9PLAT|nr:unnamed protein product [Protopolystoma xenopodis]
MQSASGGRGGAGRQGPSGGMTTFEAASRGSHVRYEWSTDRPMDNGFDVVLPFVRINQAKIIKRWNDALLTLAKNTCLGSASHGLTLVLSSPMP